jgi:predicted secreted protein
MFNLTQTRVVTNINDNKNKQTKTAKNNNNKKPKNQQTIQWSCTEYEDHN